MSEFLKCFVQISLVSCSLENTPRPLTIPVEVKNILISSQHDFLHFCITFDILK